FSILLAISYCLLLSTMTGFYMARRTNILLIPFNITTTIEFNITLIMGLTSRRTNFKTADVVYTTGRKSKMDGSEGMTSVTI
ncbi:hypothetical protein I619_15534, partial [Listeria monocytogenes SHL010]